MTASALVTAPLALAAILAVAAVAKVTPPRAHLRHEAALTGRGIPSVINAAWVRRFHPWLELVLAITLLALPWPWVLLPASATLLLCGAYLWIIAAVVATDEPQDCACFGRLSSGPVTRADLVRNVGLLALAAVAFAWAVAGRSVGADVAAFSTGDWWWLAVAALASLTPWVFRLATRRLRAVDQGGRPTAVGPTPSSHAADAAAGAVRHNLAPRRAPASLDEAQPEDLTSLALPDIVVTDAAGQPAPLRRVCSGVATLLILVRPSCHACDAVLAQLGPWQERFGDRVQVRLLVSKRPEKFAEQHAELADLTLTDASRAIAPLLGVHYTPSALLIAPDASIAAGPTTGAEYITSLAEVIIDSIQPPQE
ncbi:TlpA family protein disulfide reductase [Zhihengliuella flava]|uniref:Methylamine utilisation protein MauE domain-containing protein n=1 Tax=Zhihengliuella flava TaxID=1285193 RepID=A0A931DBS2_9MICC|nr:MauE/DoxX family redox-associated membrane protein [Zhihengliuella flava]MBG6083963.1 hypothetical protein [Zhihengliuella flava]